MIFPDNLTIDKTTLPIISQLAECIPGGFFIYHADGNQELIYFNSHLPMIFGCDDAEDFKRLVGNSFKGIVHPEDYSKNESNILAQINESASKLDHVRYRFTRKDGSIGMMDDYGHFSHSDTFGYIYYVFVQDITEQYKKEQEHKENIARIMALSDNFGSLYDVDLQTNSYVVYANNHLLSDEQIDTMVNCGDFFADTVKNAELVIYPDDREELIHVLSRDFVLKTLETESYFDWYYRLLVENGTKWARLRFVYKDKSRTHLIVGAFNAEKEMAAKLQAEQERKELIASISGSRSAYIINPRNDSYTVIARNKYLNDNYPSDESYNQSIARYIEKDVYEPDRKAAAEALSLQSLVSHLENAKEYVFRLRDISTGVPIWYEMRAVKLSEAEILFAFYDRNKEIIGEMLFNRMRENYFGLYYVNLDVGLAQILKSGHPEVTGEAGTTVQYTALLKKIAATADGEAAEILDNMGDIDYLKDYFAVSEVGYAVYKSNVFGEDVWSSITGLVLERHEDGTPSVFALGFSLLDEKASEKEEAKLQLRKISKDLAKEKRRNDILHDIIHSGKWTFFVNENDEIIGSDVSAEANIILRNDVPADGHSWLAIVHPDDRESAAAAFNATIRDHSGKTPYDVNYRMIDRNGEYRWFHSAGRIIRSKDGKGEFFGIHVDINDQMEEQQKRLLGAIPLSPDVLSKARIGLWAFELDEGQPPRMYADETMLTLLGLSEQTAPEKIYHAWYDHIDKDSYTLVHDAVEKMISGEHAEVQYPWHHPDGRTIVVRCGGVRNPGYHRGIRIEGTHQDVTQTLHFDEKVARRQQLELEIFKTRAEMLTFISDHEPDVDKFLNFFGRRVLEVTGGDQVIFRNMDNHRIVVADKEIEDIPQDICAECPFAKFRNDEYGDAGIVMMSDCSQGFRGIMTHPRCPAKSSFMQKVYSDDKLVGLLTVHYLKDKHEFTENDIEILKTVGQHLGLLLIRIAAKKSNMEKLQAESSSAAKTQFLFNMSHDIRTPMNAIIGFTNMAKKEICNPEKALDSLSKVQLSSEILLNLINDVLDMSRIESGKVELHEEKCEITEAFNSFEPAMASLAASKDIDLTFSIEKIRNRFIFADGPRFDRVLINIISNAIKYTLPNGFVKVSVEQLTDTKPGYGNYRFTVADSGIGMSPEFQKHMFEDFTREENSTTSGIQGTGLGLSLAKKLVDLMGGTISCASTQGVGTTFTIVFPFRLQTENDMAEKVVVPQAHDAIDLNGKKALLVEDNELNREIGEEILSDKGVVVETAENGQIAVNKIRARGEDYYDFILMDIQMPIMNGYEATRAIRNLMPGLKAPIIALSANAFAEDKRKSLEAGMDDHVAKPINAQELESVLAKFL